MITVSRTDFNQRFKLKFSEPGTGWRGYSVKAESLAEVNAAMAHYFGAEYHRGENKDCPLCRMMMEEDAQRARKGVPSS